MHWGTRAQVDAEKRHTSPVIPHRGDPRKRALPSRSRSAGWWHPLIFAGEPSMLRLVILVLAILTACAVWAGEITSGGLGLSRVAWEARHGEPDPESRRCPSPSECYGGRKYTIAFIGDHVFHLEIHLGKGAGPSRQALRALVTQFIPTDAHLVESYQKPDGWWVELYTSKSLATLDPLMRPIGTIGTRKVPMDFWFGSPPGTFTVNFEPEGHRVVIGTGGDI